MLQKSRACVLLKFCGVCYCSKLDCESHWHVRPVLFAATIPLRVGRKLPGGFKLSRQRDSELRGRTVGQVCWLLNFQPRSISPEKMDTLLDPISFLIIHAPCGLNFV